MLKNNKAFSSFSVDDIEKAKDFYGQILGLDFTKTAEGLKLHLSGGGQIFIYPKPSHEPATFTVLNFMVDDIEAMVDKLAKQGIKFEYYNQEHLKTDEKGIMKSPDRSIAWFKDPAGNFLSIIE